MSIEVEDRTEESSEAALARRIAPAGQLLILAAIEVSDATPVVGMGGLALALGQGAAKVGANIDEVVRAVRQHFEAAALARAEQGSADRGEVN
jgi:hypothetical protein